MNSIMFYKNYYLFMLLTNIIFINCYSYLSTYEAFYNTNDGHGICLGNCKEDGGLKKCVYDWSAHEIACKETSTVTKRYRTINNVLCYSNCDYFNYPYQWCVTNITKIEWDYCNRNIATKGTPTYRTNDKYISCTDSCWKRSSYYDWCHTLSSWHYCDPDKKILLFDYRTEDDTICATPCELYTDNIAYCYDKNEKWKKCYLNPEYEGTLNLYNNNIESNCRPGDYTLNGYVNCKKNKHKRYSQFTQCNLNVENIARDYERNNPTVTVRAIDPDNIISLDNNPVLSYTVFPIHSYFGNDQVNLPLVIRAIITTHTLRNAGERENFRAEINRHFNNMGPILNHVNYDERGHIIGSRLGGPTETYNIFPQSWNHNRGRMSRWQYMEADLDNFVRNYPNRYAEYTAIMSYGTNNNGNLIYRPTGIGLRIRLYDNGRLVDMRGNHISYSTNSLENMYYTNDPDYSCVIEGDEIENNFN